MTSCGDDQNRNSGLWAVALSCARLGADSLAARLFKELAPNREPCDRETLDRLAECLGIAPGDRAEHLHQSLKWAREACARAKPAGLDVHQYYTPAYPDWLWTIIDPPIVLWTRGDVAALSEPVVAIVGARAASPTGLLVARRLAAELTEAGLTIASGMARGVDAAAHEGALAAGGRTIAVLGCGADVVYPPEHGRLAARIREQGVIVSELPPSLPPFPYHFPLRNRIISGLSRAVVVIEAGDKSGSLITARMGMEQGRSVLAVPGAIASGRYRGSHALIKDGARLVETVEDILDEIRWVSNSRAAAIGANVMSASELEQSMDVGEPVTIDDLAVKLGRSTSSLLADLAAAEIAGRVARVPGGGFVKLDGPAIDRTTRRGEP